MSADDIVVVPYAEDPLARLATQLLTRARDHLPDLSRNAVLFPAPAAAPRFRKILLGAAGTLGHPAVLPPFVGTLSAWAGQFAPSPEPVLGQTRREVLLLESLQEHPALHGEGDAWPLIDALLALFEELSVSGRGLPDDLPALERTLAAGYRMTDVSLRPFSNEAGLLHTLWNAWRTHLREHGLVDAALRYREQLHQSLAALHPGSCVFLAGFTDFSDAEIEWIRSARARHQLVLLLHGQTGGAGYHPDAPLSRLLQRLEVDRPDAPTKTSFSAVLDEAFGLAETPFRSRAEHVRKTHPVSPLEGRLTVLDAASAETEARAVELQVRRWWLEGKRNIGVVTNDRKLARRVRALLERAHLVLNDGAGWPLSTTSSATALMQLWEALEQDFAHAALFALLKSPFAFGSLELETRHLALARFERDVVWPRRITRGLERYRSGLRQRRGLLNERYGPDTGDALEQLFARLDSAAADLLSLRESTSAPASAFLAGLRKALEEIEAVRAFADDAAGQELLAELDAMDGAAQARPLKLSWTGFRAWLAHNLERRRFRPGLQGTGVELMGFAESRLYRFDALVIAGAHEDQLPGDIHSGFFNEGVRRELGLRTHSDAHCSLFYDFRRLLESADEVLVTIRREDAGEVVIASPWLERLRSFHALAYGHTLAPQELQQLLLSDESCISVTTPAPPVVDFPRTRVPAPLLDSSLSASAHQRMIDCPYQFFALHALRLADWQELPSVLTKSDYGRYVHRILEAFHADVPGLPGPFSQPLTEASRTRAEGLLEKIAQAVFAGEIAQTRLALAWLYRWKRVIPQYIDWELRRGGRWQIAACELEATQSVGGGKFTIKGRLDRVDRGPEGAGIIDYKTGAVPSGEAIACGEDIQLPFYAELLDEPVASATFLALERDRVHDRASLAGSELEALRNAVIDRLVAVHGAAMEGAPLPAWGDSQTCMYCPVEGVCRREFWDERPPNG